MSFYYMAAPGNLELSDENINVNSLPGAPGNESTAFDGNATAQQLPESVVFTGCTTATLNDAASAEAKAKCDKALRAYWDKFQEIPSIRTLASRAKVHRKTAKAFLERNTDLPDRLQKSTGTTTYIKSRLSAGISILPNVKFGINDRIKVDDNTAILFEKYPKGITLLTLELVENLEETERAIAEHSKEIAEKFTGGLKQYLVSEHWVFKWERHENDKLHAHCYCPLLAGIDKSTIRKIWISSLPPAALTGRDGELYEPSEFIVDILPFPHFDPNQRKYSYTYLGKANTTRSRRLTDGTLCTPQAWYHISDVLEAETKARVVRHKVPVYLGESVEIRNQLKELIPADWKKTCDYYTGEVLHEHSRIEAERFPEVRAIFDRFAHELRTRPDAITDKDNYESIVLEVHPYQRVLIKTSRKRGPKKRTGTGIPEQRSTS